MAKGDLLAQSDEIDHRVAQDSEQVETHERSAVPRVVIPLDGSPLSEQALGIGQTLACLLGGRVELVHVIDPHASLFDATLGTQHHAEEYLQKWADTFPATVPAQIRVLHGSPVDEMLRYLSGASNTIVAMSTHGLSGLQRFLFGSVADKVIRGVTVPVVVVRDATTFSRSLRNLIVPLDGSELAAGALPIAMTLAQHDRTLGIVRVVDLSHTHENLTIKYGSVFTDSELLAEMTADVEREARASLEDMALRLRAAGCRTSWEVRVGRPSDEIIRAAETTGTDLIIMATHGLGGVRRWAFGSVTDEVLHRSNIPVLVIPPHSDWRAFPQGGDLR